MTMTIGMRRVAALCLVAAATPAAAEGDAAAGPHAFLRDNPAATAAAPAADVSAPAVATSPVRAESASGVVRQTPSVALGCLKPELMGILRRASSHYRSEVVVTSGFRGGRGRSYHAKCMAADVQIAGVGPAALARWFRGQDDVGGVGTYGHTRSVHVDIAPRRMSWHGRSSRRIRMADGGCPCCGGRLHGGRSAFVCEQGVVTAEGLKLGSARG
jgi:Peptidase M15